MKVKSEHQIQVLAIQYIRTAAPGLIIYAIPNGGLRNFAVARKLKAEGVLAGVPDLHIPHRSGKYNSLYIEVKKKNGKLTESQKKVIPMLEFLDNKVLVCYSLKEIIHGVADYMGGGYYWYEQLKNFDWRGDEI